MIEPVDRVSALGDRLGLDRFDIVLAAVIALMSAISLVSLVDPSLNRIIVDGTLDVALSSLSLLAAIVLSAFAMLRYRESGRVSALLQASAFLTLGILDAAVVALVLGKLYGRAGLTLGMPEQLPLYVSATVWLTVAGVLAASGLSALREARGRAAHARWLVLAPPLVIIALTVVVYPERGQLPSLIDDAGLKLLITEPDRVLPLPGVTPLADALAAVTAALFLAAALLYRTSYVRNGRVADGYLSVALIVASFSEIQQVFYPGVYTGLVTGGQFMRFLALLVLVVGIYAEQRADLRALRAANAELDRMRLTERERAALEERTRLAREIHDGLAQQLWFAKLKFDRLAATLPSEDSGQSEEVAQALDAALAEARQATMTMRTSIDQDLPLSDMIGRVVEDFAQRSEIQATFQADPDVPLAVPPRHQVELLRITQESLTNVRRHADATVVRVKASVVDGSLLITVTDNGRGFDPETGRHGGLGVLGMEERARLIGGSLHITSAPSEGTTVALRVPLILPPPLVGADGEAVDLSIPAPEPAGG
jgi:two-component system sensor histidine kinase UhpB